jgi:hypothetical protein
LQTFRLVDLVIFPAVSAIPEQALLYDLHQKSGDF